MNNRIFFSLIILFSCNSNQPRVVNGDLAPIYSEKQFADYWYAGKAEVASYDLLQHRYGEVRKGSAVLVFVTEPFSEVKQVKMDNPGTLDDHEVTVMKMNATRKFITGIYPYSVMTSVFTPVQENLFPNTLKTTFSAQEWCGQTFLQINLSEGKYHSRGFSYFEKEGDAESQMKIALLEDEIFNRIRLNPNALPLGTITVIPSTLNSRFSHIPLQPIVAEANLEDKGLTWEYSLNYADIPRSISVEFDAQFPFKIKKWTEINRVDGKEQVTTAIFKKDLHIDYWKKNASEFEYLRDSLLLN